MANADVDSTTPLTVWAACPYDWIDRKAPAGKPADILSMPMSINEYEHTAFVVTASKDVEHVTFEVELRGFEGELTLREVRWLLPELEVDTWSHYQMRKDVFGGLDEQGNPVGEVQPMPELLEEPDGSRSMIAGESVHYWITAHSQGVRPGRYKGNVSISSQAGTKLNVPLVIEIWPITLPVEHDLLYGVVPFIPGPKSLAEPFAMALKEHYCTIASVEVPAVEGGRLDWGVLDIKDRIQVIRDMGMKVLLFGSASPMRDRWFNLDDEQLKWYFRSIDEDLKAMGLTNKDYWLYLFDAPHSLRDRAIEVLSIIKEINPAIQLRFAIVERVFRSKEDKQAPTTVEFRRDILKTLKPLVDWWLPCLGFDWFDPGTLNFEACYDLMRQAQREGDAVVFYHNHWRSVGNRPYDNPESARRFSTPGQAHWEELRDKVTALSGARRGLWWVWEHGLDGQTSFAGGISYAGVPSRTGFFCPFTWRRYGAKVTSWGTIPPVSLPPEKQAVPQYLFIRSTPVWEDGQMSYDYRIVSCKRLEALRDSMKDYLYLSTLERLVKKIEDSHEEALLPAAADANEVLQKALSAVYSDPDNWQCYNNAKVMLASEILKLQRLGFRADWPSGRAFRQHPLKFP